MMLEDDISSHRVRSNRWPEPLTPQPSQALTQAVNEVYEALEDRW
jgi:hypothetical protein